MDQQQRIAVPYLCYRCGFNTEYKKTMSDHLHKRKKLCKPRVNDVELTEEIKATILKSRVYRPTEDKVLHEYTPSPPKIIKEEHPVVRVPTAPIAPRQPPTYIRVNINLPKEGTKPVTATVQRRPLCKLLRTLIWNVYIGEHFGVAKCVCCKHNEIRQSSFHCGHVISVSEGGDNTIDNLRPICDICNYSMGTRNMEDFMRDYGLGPLPPKLYQTPGNPIETCKSRESRVSEGMKHDHRRLSIELAKTLLNAAKEGDYARVEKMMLDFVNDNEIGEIQRINVYELLREMRNPACQEFSLYNRLVEWDWEDPSTDALIDFMNTL